jgi:hypothetical protein
MQGIAQQVLANPGKYSIQQLQQGVQSGVIPAYIAVPLIQEKVQQQKQSQMMQAMQQPPAQERPPVAQQVMSEARGLEALPTNLPTQYAGGGIVAFDEGGQVPRYQVGGTAGSLYDLRRDPLLRQIREGVPVDAQTLADRAAMADTIDKITAAGKDILTLPGRGILGALETGVTRPLRAAGVPIPYLPKSVYGGDSSSMTPYMDALRRQQGQEVQPTSSAQPTDLGPVPGTSESTGILGGVSTGTAPAARPDTGGGLRLPGAGGVATGAPKLKLPEGPSYEKMAKDYFGGYEAEAKKRDEAAQQKIEAARAKVTGTPFEGLEASLKKEEAEAKTEKDQAGYMAVFEAGLAMLSGTSPFALANIGAGGKQGLASYKDAMKDMRKAEKERQKQFAYIEQARRAEKIGDRDTEIASIEKARDRADSQARYVGEGIYKATGMDKATAIDIATKQFGSDSDIFKTHVAGGYTLGAAALRQREGINPYQMARLRQEAEKQVDPNAIRAQVAQELKLSKAPKPGADATFEKRVQAAYNAAIEERVGRNLGYGLAGAGGGGGGMQLPQGYRVLGTE